MIDEEIKETDTSLTQGHPGEQNVDSEQAVVDSLNNIEQRAKSIAFNSLDGFLAFGFGLVATTFSLTFGFVAATRAFSKLHIAA